MERVIRGCDGVAKILNVRQGRELEVCKRLVEGERRAGLFCGKDRKSSGGFTSNSPGIANAILLPARIECQRWSVYSLTGLST